MKAPKPVRLTQLSAFLCLSSCVTLAHAWSHTEIQSDNVTLDLERNGGAVVTHELLLQVGGGPLKSFSVDGVDADAQPLPDATLTAAKSGHAAGVGIPLATSVDNGTAHLSTDDKGVKSGIYLLKFSYHTDLLGRGLIHQDGEEADLRWVGPRFSDGIDSARVVFRIPPAAHAPHLPKVDSVDGKLGIVEEYDGVFLSAARRAEDKDELEVVRPYVAKGEPVVWLVKIDSRALDLSQPKAANDLRPSPEPPPKKSPRSHEWLLATLASLGVGLLYAALVRKKSGYVRAGALAVGTKPKPLIRLPEPWRIILAGVALAAATATLLLAALPFVAALFLVGGMLCGTHLPPPPLQVRRGPGFWRPVKVSQVFNAPLSEPLPGAWLDLGRAQGFCLFVAAIGGLVLVAARVFLVVPERGALIALEALALVPLFCTGRASEFPSTAIVRSKSLLLALYRQLKKRPNLSVKLIARFQQGAALPDEVRLAVAPNTGLDGFRGIEVGCELRSGWGGQLILPVVLVRAIDASPSYEALPRSLNWMRGRTSDERVCVVHPKLPSRRNSLKLIDDLCETLQASASAPRTSATVTQRTSAPKESGTGERSRKAVTTSSPAHAT